MVQAARRALDDWLADQPVMRKVLFGPILAVTAVLLAIAVALVLAMAQGDEAEEGRIVAVLDGLHHARSELQQAQGALLRTTATTVGAARPVTVATTLRHVDDALTALTDVDGAAELRLLVLDYGAAVSGLAGLQPGATLHRNLVATIADLRFATVDGALAAGIERAATTLAAERRDRTREIAQRAAVVAAAVALALAAALAVAQRAATTIARPLRGLAGHVLELAHNDLGAATPERQRRDEIGAIAVAIDRFRDTAETLHRRAFFDPLTGVANRSAFLQHLRRALGDQQRHRRRFAVLLLDLDHFKEVNDSLGHAVGDRLLAQMAARLRRAVRPSDTLARLGGDEFAVLQTDLDANLPSERLAQRIVDAARQPFEVDGHTVHVGASVGIALCPEDGIADDELLRHADLALYEVKSQGRQGWRFFTRDMHDAVVERRRLETELRHALEAGEVQFVYQPKLDLRTNRIVGVETLARWRHADWGTVAPERFIAIAESTGLIEPLGTRALTSALEAVADWEALACDDFTVAVNLSLTQLRRAGFADDVEQALRVAAVAPRRLLLEITESLFADDDPNVLAALDDLGALGVRMALDDFGTGYASLRHLNRLPFEELKIDRSFVREVTTSPDAAAIVRAIVGVGQALSLQVTAEGIETEAERRFLLEAGATLGQGFLLGAPMPPTDVAAVLMRPPTAPAEPQAASAG